jgi:hypothetical protein
VPHAPKSPYALGLRVIVVYEIRGGVSGSGAALRLVQVCVAGVALGLLARSVGSPAAYTRDLQVEYLSARALRDGADMLQPLNVLSARYFPVPTDNFRHPNPHPPLLSFLAIPMTLVSFPVALGCWLAANVILLLPIGASARPVAAREPGARGRGRRSGACWRSGRWRSSSSHLLVFAWDASDARHDWRAGAALGIASGLKLYPLVLLVPYVARRRFRVVAAAAAVFALVQLGNLAVVGPAGFVRLYTEIVPAVSAIYARLAINVSAWGALLRIFGGAADVLPLMNAPAVVVPLALVCAALGLVALWRLEPRVAPVAAFAILPTVWYYHPVLCLPQIAALLRRERRAATALAVAATSVVIPLANAFLGSAAFRGISAATGNGPALATVLTVVEPAGLLALLVLSLPSRHAPACDAVLDVSTTVAPSGQRG